MDPGPAQEEEGGRRRRRRRPKKVKDPYDDGDDEGFTRDLDGDGDPAGYAHNRCKLDDGDTLTVRAANDGRKYVLDAQGLDRLMPLKSLVRSRLFVSRKLRGGLVHAVCKRTGEPLFRLALNLWGPVRFLDGDTSNLRPSNVIPVPPAPPRGNKVYRDAANKRWVAVWYHLDGRGRQRSYFPDARFGSDMERSRLAAEALVARLLPSTPPPS